MNRDGTTGFTREVGDIEGLANAISTILSDQKLARKMGRAGRDIAKNEFAADKIVPKYIQLYEKILSA